MGNKMHNMPLIEYVKDLHSEICLKDVCIIGVQHLLMTNYHMIKSLVDNGLQMENVFLIGKCYSSSVEVFDKMIEDGMAVCPSSLDFDSHKSFDEFFEENTIDFMSNVLNKLNLNRFKKIIILDDGGHLIEAANEIFPDTSKLVGVEQTTAGVRLVESLNLSFPVINVARSDAKLVYESPYIARAVIKTVTEIIDNEEANIQKVLVIGSGAIGGAVSRAIGKNHNVVQFDLDESKSDIKVNELDSRLSEFDAVIGCTGKVSLTKEQLKKLKKGCILLSASSSDREFDVLSMRQKLKAYDVCHQDIEVDGLKIVNSGFPVNFRGKKHSVAPTLIQLTRSLMIAAIFQACQISDRTTRLSELETSIQGQIVNEYLTIRGVRKTRKKPLIQLK